MNEELFDTINGYFVHTIYKSDTYMVCKFETSDDTITVTGPAFDFIKGDHYLLTGNYVDHPKYGFQFNIITIKRYIPNKKDDIIKFLSSNSFKGIGKKAATKIYEAFGDDSINIIKEKFYLVENIGLNTKQINGLKEGIEYFNEDNNETILLLISAGFSNSEAHRIYYHYKDDTAFIFNDNPYRFYLDVPNIPFNKVLTCAKNLDFEDKEYKFKEAYLIYIFKELSFNSGNIYLDYEDFADEYLKNYSDIDIALKKCIDDNEIIFENDHYYYKQEYYDEIDIANYLKNNNETLLIEREYLKDLIKQNEFELSSDFKYDTNQTQAIFNFFSERFSIIIGGPGTGKTTLINALSSIYKVLYPYQNIIVVAPTGRAAKRINEICNVESKTIHSLLKWNKETNKFIQNKENPINYDCLIIDEFSMVDNNLFASLLNASTYVKKICIIGDINQLPSIRQGNLLKDLVESKLFETTYLSFNHRQKEGNEIIELANDIVNGTIDFNKYQNDVKFIDIKHTSLNSFIEMISNEINSGTSLDDIQVLSPMYRGDFGIDNLNSYLQATFNPPSKSKNERKVGKQIFRVGDKILQLKNRPTDDVYNGDIGVLNDIDDYLKSLMVNFDGINVFYETDELTEISLAYCLSVHKAQGSEYNTVYFICSKNHINMLYKQLIYTGISRAKSKLIIIGDEELFKTAIKKELNQRKTSLLSRLVD